MSENTQVQTTPIAYDGNTAMAMLSDDKQMDRIIRFAEIMATGRATIPKELQNVGDCMAITMQAMSWKMNPISVAQKIFFINGKIGYEAQLVAAAITNSGAIEGDFDFEWYGPWEKVIGKFEIKKNEKGQEYRVPGWRLADEAGIGIKVWATRIGESKPKVMDVLLAQARTRNSTQWADDPKQQLAYLAEKKWARLYTPGVILGVYTRDELTDPNMTVIDGATGEIISKGSENWLEPILTRIKNAPDLATLNAACREGRDQCKEGSSEYEQLKAARSAKLAELKATTQPVSEPPVQKKPTEREPVTFAFVEDKLNSAKDRDALDIAADWIRELPKDKQQELVDLYQARAEGMV